MSSLKVSTLTLNSGENTSIAIASDDLSLRVLANGVERMIVKNDGKVGVGITNPTESFHVIGNGLFSQTLTSNNLIVRGNVTSNGTFTVNTEQIIVGTTSVNTTITAANITTQNITVGNLTTGNIELSGQILKSGIPFLLQRANMVVFTVSGTYTPTANVEYGLVIATGAGGTGGGADTDGTAGAGGSGGAAGGTAIKVYPYNQLINSGITIGVRGAAGAATGTSGTTGGNTIFVANATNGGVSLFANGGSAGIGSGTVATQGSSAGTPGGTATGGDINLIGGSGDAGAGSDASNMGLGGQGGASFWGGGGFGGKATSSAPTDVTGGAAGLTTYGAGGGGAGSSDSITGAVGGFSANGVVVILEFTA